MFDSDYHHRRSIRLKNYDYSTDGAYFVTIVTHERQFLFGDVLNGEMQLNARGLIVAEEWKRTQTIRPHITLDAFVVMPNHIHGVLIFDNWGSGFVGAQRLRPSNATELKGASIAPLRRDSQTLGSVIAGFKSGVTARIKKLPNLPLPVWQRNYNEHIIRDGHELERIREYILCNPLAWVDDIENPVCQPLKTKIKKELWQI